MRRFAGLCDRIDQTTEINAKVRAVAEYAASTPAHDVAWAAYFLAGRRLRRLVTAADLSAVLADLSRLPGWLISECLSTVGNLAETTSRVLDATGALAREPSDLPLHEWVEDRLESLRAWEAADRRARLREWLAQCDAAQAFLLVRLVTGEFRVGGSSILVTRGLAQSAGIDPDIVAHRLMGQWRPSAAFLARVLAPPATDEDRARPYPFCLAMPVDPSAPTTPGADRVGALLGPREDYLAEWVWDGLRAQVIRRGCTTAIWSRGEELLTDRFPELIEAAARLPSGCVLDGEILAYKDGRPLSFARLQRRVGGRHITARALAESPVVFMAYDVLEESGEDVRQLPLRDRRALLERVMAAVTTSRLLLSPTIEAQGWPGLARERNASRRRGVEGLMLKRLDSAYSAGRQQGAWWKWKAEPYRVDAVLVSAQPGHGRRASLLTDYTFAVWDGGTLVPLARACSGLTLEEIALADAWIRRNTIERFGPVRVVKPEHVFELHFEALGPSSRNRSGITCRFPRIARWRAEKSPRDADTLAAVRRMLAATGQPLEPTMFDHLDHPGERGDDASTGPWATASPFEGDS